MTGEEEVVSALDALVVESHSSNLSPHRLLQLGAEISAWRYTLGTLVAEAEIEAMRTDHYYDQHLISGRLTLQANDSKLSTAKADDRMKAMPKSMELYQEAMRSKLQYKYLKNRLDTSNDVLVSISQRVKRAENEMAEARFQQPR